MFKSPKLGMLSVLSTAICDVSLCAHGIQIPLCLLNEAHVTRDDIMSAAGSIHELVQPLNLADDTDSERDAEEQVSWNRLKEICPPSALPVIAVDLDDVLSLTNHAIAECKHM